MQLTLKYALALSIGLAVIQSQAEMVPASSLNGDADGSSLAARVLNKDSQNNFNSHFSNLNSLSKSVVKLSRLKSRSLKKSLQ
jgi:rare lipoprotein A